MRVSASSGMASEDPRAIKGPSQVFNCSIHGAGMKHDILLLLQVNSETSAGEARKLAESLYASASPTSLDRITLA
jgi:hypothetical protein